jgi:hypothetical protein
MSPEPFDSDAGSEQPSIARFDRADGLGAARLADVGHVNEAVRKRNQLPFDSLHRLITAGTHHYWKLCFRSDHNPLPITRVRWRNVFVRCPVVLINRPRRDSEMSQAHFQG